MLQNLFGISRNLFEFRENFANINDFIIAKFREIQNNIVNISCFAKI